VCAERGHMVAQRDFIYPTQMRVSFLSRDILLVNEISIGHKSDRHFAVRGRRLLACHYRRQQTTSYAPASTEQRLGDHKPPFIRPSTTLLCSLIYIEHTYRMFIVSDGHRADHLHDSELYILISCERPCRCVSVGSELPTVSRSSVDLKLRVNDDDDDDDLMYSRLIMQVSTVHVHAVQPMVYKCRRTGWCLTTVEIRVRKNGCDNDNWYTCHCKPESVCLLNVYLRPSYNDIV